MLVAMTIKVYQEHYNYSILASTTFVKHFITDINSTSGDNASDRILVAGYCNVTAAIDGVQFSFSTGNIDSGDIKLYGIS